MSSRLGIASSTFCLLERSDGYELTDVYNSGTDQIRPVVNHNNVSQPISANVIRWMQDPDRPIIVTIAQQSVGIRQSASRANGEWTYPQTTPNGVGYSPIPVQSSSSNRLYDDIDFACMGARFSVASSHDNT
jgi:hypothetical protein